MQQPPNTESFDPLSLAAALSHPPPKARSQPPSQFGKGSPTGDCSSLSPSGVSPDVSPPHATPSAISGLYFAVDEVDAAVVVPVGALH